MVQISWCVNKNASCDGKTKDQIGIHWILCQFFPSVELFCYYNSFKPIIKNSIRKVNNINNELNKRWQVTLDKGHVTPGIWHMGAEIWRKHVLCNVYFFLFLVGKSCGPSRWRVFCSSFSYQCHWFLHKLRKRTTLAPKRRSYRIQISFVAKK